MIDLSMFVMTCHCRKAAGLTRQSRNLLFVTGLLGYVRNDALFFLDKNYENLKRLLDFFAGFFNVTASTIECISTP